MCLACQYGTFGRCEDCKSKTCYEELRCNRQSTNCDVCDDCWKNKQKSGKCLICGEKFESRNKLFLHLKSENHYRTNEIKYKYI